MSSQSLWIQIPEIILIPLLAFVVITLIKGATAARRYSNEQAVDVGLDLCVLATGASGSIFANDTLYAKWGIGVVVYGILATLACILFAGILAWRRRWHNRRPVSQFAATVNIFIGVFAVEMVTAFLIMGYTLAPRR